MNFPDVFSSSQNFKNKTRDAQENFLAVLEEKRRRSIVESLKKYATSIYIPGVPDNEEDVECENFYAEKMTPAHHHIVIMDALQQVAEGKIKHLMILAPPGSAKSSFASVVFPTWYMGRYPNKNVLMVTYGSDLAKKFGRKCRQIVRSKEYQQIFGISLKGDNAAVDDWALQNESTYMCGGIRSGITGNRADVLIIDDPFKGREDAESPAKRAKTWDEYEASAKSRLKPSGVEIIINTRWHEADLSGLILPQGYNGENGFITSRSGELWYVICIPAQAEREDDILGRKIGEFLWTDWFPHDWWEQTKKTQARNWSSLYQQRPVASAGAILKSEWWKLWPQKEPPSCDLVIQSYDTAFMAKEEADDTARTTWGIFQYVGKDGIERMGCILLEARFCKVGFPELREMVLEGAKEYKPDLILIENKGSGISLGQELKRTTRLPIKMMDVKGDKVSRAHISSGYLEGGSVWYMDRAWAKDVIHQCAMFPKGEHDDIVDSCTMFWNWARKRFALDVEYDDVPTKTRPRSTHEFKGYGN